MGFVDNRKSGFCPSIYLTSEKIQISMKEYLEIVQKNCKGKKQSWHHLGKIETKCGLAELIEIETKSQLGSIRLLQAILYKDSEVFILTAGALKKEFSKHAPAIESAFRSMDLCGDLFEKVENQKVREKLLECWQKRKENIESYKKMVLEQEKLGSVWQLLMLKE